MRRQLAPVWSSLARHLRGSEILRDLALLTAIGALASFAILFVSRIAFDDTVHELSLTYSARHVGSDAAHGDLSLTEYDSAVVAPAPAASGLHGGGNLDLTVLTFAQGAPVAQWLSGAVQDGAACSDGLMVDEATAAHFGAGVGDELTLWWPDRPGGPSGRVRVCGILNVWHPNHALGTRGYAVVSQTYLARAIPAMGEAQPDQALDYWFRAEPPGSESKGTAVRRILFDQVGWSSAVLVISLMGVALWAFGVARVWSGFWSALGTPSRVLGRLGARPVLLGGFVGTLTLALAVIGGGLSAAVARAFIGGWTDLFVSSRQIGLVVAGLVTVAGVMVVLLARRPQLRERFVRHKLVRQKAGASS